MKFIYILKQNNEALFINLVQIKKIKIIAEDETTKFYIFLEDELLIVRTHKSIGFPEFSKFLNNNCLEFFMPEIDCKIKSIDWEK
jgi:hypothetical protein